MTTQRQCKGTNKKTGHRCRNQVSGKFKYCHRHRKNKSGGKVSMIGGQKQKLEPHDVIVPCMGPREGKCGWHLMDGQILNLGAAQYKYPPFLKVTIGTVKMVLTQEEQEKNRYILKGPLPLNLRIFQATGGERRYKNGESEDAAGKLKIPGDEHGLAFFNDDNKTSFFHINLKEYHAKLLQNTIKNCRLLAAGTAFRGGFIEGLRGERIPLQAVYDIFSQNVFSGGREAIRGEYGTSPRPQQLTSYEQIAPCDKTGLKYGWHLMDDQIPNLGSMYFVRYVTPNFLRVAIKGKYFVLNKQANPYDDEYSVGPPTYVYEFGNYEILPEELKSLYSKTYSASSKQNYGFFELNMNPPNAEGLSLTEMFEIANVKVQFESPDKKSNKIEDSTLLRFWFRAHVQHCHLRYLQNAIKHCRAGFENERGGTPRKRRP